MKPLLPDTQKTTLTRLRIIWFAMLLAQAMLFFILIIVMRPTSPTVPSTNPGVVRVMQYMSIGMVVVMLPLGYVTRLQTYKKNWVINSVTPAGYFTGNMLLFALCEVVSMFTIITTYLAGVLMPFILPAVVASMTQVINWPTGKPMQPAEPDLGGR